MNIFDHPIFDGYDKEWERTCRDLTPQEWAEGYDRAFRADLKNRGLQPLPDGRIQLQLSQAQGEAFERVRRSKSVLDFGCGPGYLTAALLGNKVDAVGVDCSAEAVAFCKSHAGGKWSNRFLQEVPERKFEAVLAVEVLEHLPDPAATLRMLWDRVADGGQVVITVPKDGMIPSPYHLHIFTYDRVVDLAKTVCNVPGQPEYVADISTTDREYVLHIKKEPLLLKYCQVFAHTRFVGAANDILQTGRFKTGVFNWCRIFNGVTLRLEDLANGDPRQWDVIHLQMAGDSFDYPSRLRRLIGPKGGRTKLVVNVDYPPEVWPLFPPYPELLLEQLGHADVVFAQNTRTAGILSEFLGVSVPICPHPVDTEALREQRRPLEGRDRQQAMVMAHRDLQVYNPYWILKDLGFTTHLMGYQSPNRSTETIDYPHFFYSHIYPYVSGEDLLKTLRDMWVCVDLYTHSVQGRSTMECAGLGIPCLGYGNVDAQRQCFPDLTTSIGNIVEHRRLLKRLMQDEEFYRKVSEKAVREVERLYSFERCKTQFMRLVSDDRSAGAGNGVPAFERASAGRIEVPRLVLSPKAGV